MEDDSAHDLAVPLRAHRRGELCEWVAARDERSNAACADPRENLIEARATAPDFAIAYVRVIGQHPDMVAKAVA